MVSPFAITRNLQPKESASTDALGELRPDQEAAMTSLAREMEGMSDETLIPGSFGPYDAPDVGAHWRKSSRPDGRNDSTHGIG